MLLIILLFTTLQVLALGESVCIKPPAPRNGRITCNKKPLVAGKACQYRCHTGYQLRGLNLRRCLSNGQWSGLPPTCISLSDTYCQLPPPLEDGTVVGCTTFKLPRVSEKCSFRCNKGYVLHGPRSVTCTSTGKYTDDNGKETFPKCLETVTYTSPEVEDPCFNNTCEQICKIEEGRAQCRCNSGYVLNVDQRSCKRHTGKPIHPTLCVYRRNPCHSNNGGCDHHCSPTQAHEVFCSCREGYRRGGNDFKKCIKIQTPGPVAHFDAIPLGSSSLYLVWKHPIELNGLTGYNIYYREVIGTELAEERVRTPQITDPRETRAILGGLKPKTKYRIAICATTSEGQGEKIYIEAQTNDQPEQQPDEPYFAWSYLPDVDGKKGVSVIYMPDFEGHSGSHFFVQYRKKGEDTWKSSPPSGNQNFIDIRGLDSGTHYEMKMVVVDGPFQTSSKVEEFETWGRTESPPPEEKSLVTPAPVTCPTNNGCEQHCSISQRGIQCSCNDGYVLHPDGMRCIDVDECLSEDLNNCQHYCKNTRGGYTCSCRRGFVLKNGHKCEDIDECASEYSNNCQHYCRNTEGSFTCYCKPGFVLMDGHKCEGCGKNSYWSFELKGCMQCPENSHTVSEGKTSIRDCICDSGFIGNPGDGITCKDINECHVNNFGCSDTCFNTPGGAYCICPHGFKLDNDNKTCIDVDECSVKNGGCEGFCHNLHGSFRCSCSEGYVLSNKDQYSCDDVDECLDNNGGCEQKCINYRGGYYCTCENGYRLDSGLKNCTDILCPALPVPPYSTVVCKKRGVKFEEMQNYYPHDTICKFSCKKGYKHASDSQIMTCQKDGTWDGTLPTCRGQNCNPLSVPENGAVHPSICSTQGIEVKQRCTFTCNPGYKLEGHPVLTCRNNLTWTYEEVPVCQPVLVRPRIECPRDITTTLKPGKNTHNITLQHPTTNVERYTVHPQWVSTGTSIEFPAGVTEVTFTAISSNSNKIAKCVAVITVLDEEPPVFEYCPDPIKIEGAGAEGEFVTWEEPVVTDNVKVESVTTVSVRNTTFAPGTYVVEYIARDIAGNTASCSFDISIMRMNCSDLADPAHGKANCMDWWIGKICQPQCEPTYMRNPEAPDYYSCDDSGIWEPSEVIDECLKFQPALSSSCPDGYTLKVIDETDEEFCVECPSNTIWSATTKMCEETR